MLAKHENRLNQRLINLLLGRRNKKNKRRNKKETNIQKFFKNGVKQMKKDLNI